MKSNLGKFIFWISRRLLGIFNYDITLSRANAEFPELNEVDRGLVRKIQSRGLTMTSFESMCVLASSCNYVIKARIEGDFVETGVWRGGSSILAALLLGSNRKCHLFDTYEGMPAPSAFDFRVGQTDASSTKSKWETLKRGTGSDWVRSSITEVKKNLKDFDVDMTKVNFVIGMVEETVKQAGIEKISLLRIDTDFYSSTKAALIELWPKLSVGGILILDDYSHWDGARRAVDEYFIEKKILMLPIPNSGGRVVVKPE